MDAVLYLVAHAWPKETLDGLWGTATADAFPFHTRAVLGLQFRGALAVP